MVKVHLDGVGRAGIIRVDTGSGGKIGNMHARHLLVLCSSLQLSSLI